MPSSFAAHGGHAGVTLATTSKHPLFFEHPARVNYLYVIYLEKPRTLFTEGQSSEAEGFVVCNMSGTQADLSQFSLLLTALT